MYSTLSIHFPKKKKKWKQKVSLFRYSIRKCWKTRACSKIWSRIKIFPFLFSHLRRITSAVVKLVLQFLSYISKEARINNFCWKIRERRLAWRVDNEPSKMSLCKHVSLAMPIAQPRNMKHYFFGLVPIYRRSIFQLEIFSTSSIQSNQVEFEILKSFYCSCAFQFNARSMIKMCN